MKIFGVHCVTKRKKFTLSRSKVTSACSYVATLIFFFF